MAFKPQWQGWSLMELMVATFIGMLLLLILVRVFLTHKHLYQLHEAIASMQERGRLAHYLLIKNLRLAGYLGCANVQTMLVTHHVDLSPIVPLLGLHIENDRHKLPTDIRDLVVKNTDVLFIQRADEDNASLYKMDVNSLTITALPSYSIGDILLISNCEQGDIFQVAHVSYDTKNFWQFLSFQEVLAKHYAANALVSKYLSLVFYIGDTGRKNAAGNSIYALYCRDFNSSKNIPTEMIEGIENMAFQYGLLNKNKTIHYHNAAAIKDWSQVVSVKILLLLTSIESAVNKPSQYQFAGKKYQAKDLRLYRQWQGYVTLLQRVR